MEILLFLESVRTPFLDFIFNVITHFGDEAVAVVVLTVFLWCGNKSAAYNMLYCTFFNLGTNQLLKNIFKVPRPWVKKPELTIVESAREAASGYSFPSGHTANATVLFGCIAANIKEKWKKILLILLILLIGFSRMYLGVHSPADVITSWVLGGAFVVGISAVCKAAEKSKKADIILNIALVLYAVIIVAYMEIMKSSADENSMDGLKNGYTILGLALGLVAARYADKYKIKWETKASIWGQILKCICGIILIALTAFLVRQPAKFITGGHFSHYAIRYFAIVAVGGILWPMTFKFWSKFGIKKEETT